MENFGSAAQADDVQKQTEQITSGPVDTGVYPGRIEEAYIVKSKAFKRDKTDKTGRTFLKDDKGEKIPSESFGLFLNIRLDTGNFVSETIYIANQDGDNFYTGEGSDDKIELPGYSIINGLANLIAGKNLDKLNFEPKDIEVRVYGQTEPDIKSVQCATELIGQDTMIACKLKRKWAWKFNQETKKAYESNTDTKDFNSIDRFFDPKTGKTATETRDNEPSAYKQKFIDLCAGKIYDERKNVKDAGVSEAEKTATDAVEPADF